MVKAAYSSGWGGDSRGLFAVFGGSRRAPWIPGAVLAWPESDVSTYRCGILVCLSISVFFFFSEFCQGRARGTEAPERDVL